VLKAALLSASPVRSGWRVHLSLRHTSGGEAVMLIGDKGGEMEAQLKWTQSVMGMEAGGGSYGRLSDPFPPNISSGRIVEAVQLPPGYRRGPHGSADPRAVGGRCVGNTTASYP
jgi:hypothetical protein